MEIEQILLTRLGEIHGDVKALRQEVQTSTARLGFRVEVLEKSVATREHLAGDVAALEEKVEGHDQTLLHARAGLWVIGGLGGVAAGAATFWDTLKSIFKP